VICNLQGHPEPFEELILYMYNVDEEFLCTFRKTPMQGLGIWRNAGERLMSRREIGGQVRL
jgi:hypothetical protein